MFKAGSTVFALAAAALIWVACEQSMSQPDTTGHTTSISVGNDFFEPKVDTVAVGSTVKWTNNGSEDHTTTSDTGAWDHQLARGGTFSQQFNQAGTFAYHCRFHGSPGAGMSGVIVVR